MVGVDLIGPEFIQRVKPGNEGEVVGTFGVDEVQAHFQVTELRDLAVHADEEVAGDSDGVGFGIAQLEQDDVGDHEILLRRV
jgi:hypothetical protein